MRTVSAIFLLSIFIVSAMLCTAPAFGLSATQGQTLAEVPQMPEITEGYVLSKHSDYGTDDRDYVRGDMLYVWAWSSRVNPYDVVEHYCQLKLDGYVHEFFLNYDMNMTPQYSYTGSFNLSRLEKTGDWDVQISLKTKPPKPIPFNPPNDVIHVSAEAPPTHKLSISSSPISGVPFTLNGVNRTTPFSSVLDEGSYTVVMPSTWGIYNFDHWEDASTDPTRTISLTADTTITAYYVLAPKYWTLTVNSEPLSGIEFTIDSAVHTTPWSGSLLDGNYTIVMPSEWTVGTEVYNFVDWDDGTTKPIRSVELTKDTAITAYYAPPTETATITGKVTDNQGNPIIGARVTIVETEQYVNTLAEPAGHYKFEGLSPGRYTIKVEASGYSLAQTSVVAEPAGTYPQNFSLTPQTNVSPPRIPTELSQVAIGSLTIFGATASVLLWRRRRRASREIKEAEYRTTLESVRLEAMLQELDNLLQKGLVSKERYETMRGEMEDKLTRIRSLKS